MPIASYYDKKSCAKSLLYGNTIVNAELPADLPQGMGAPQATDSTQGNDVEAHRSLAGMARSPPRVHIMPATRAQKPFVSASTPPNPTHVGVFDARRDTKNVSNCPIS